MHIGSKSSKEGGGGNGGSINGRIRRERVRQISNTIDSKLKLLPFEFNAAFLFPCNDSFSLLEASSMPVLVVVLKVEGAVLLILDSMNVVVFE